MVTSSLLRSTEALWVPKAWMLAWIYSSRMSVASMANTHGQHFCIIWKSDPLQRIFLQVSLIVNVASHCGLTNQVILQVNRTSYAPPTAWPGAEAPPHASRQLREYFLDGRIVLTRHLILKQPPFLSKYHWPVPGNVSLASSFSYLRTVRRTTLSCRCSSSGSERKAFKYSLFLATSLTSKSQVGEMTLRRRKGVTAFFVLLEQCSGGLRDACNDGHKERMGSTSFTASRLLALSRLVLGSLGLALYCWSSTPVASSVHAQLLCVSVLPPGGEGAVKEADTIELTVLCYPCRCISTSNGWGCLFC